MTISKVNNIVLVGTDKAFVQVGSRECLVHPDGGCMRLTVITPYVLCHLDGSIRHVVFVDGKITLLGCLSRGHLIVSAHVLIVSILDDHRVWCHLEHSGIYSAGRIGHGIAATCA